MLEDINLGDYLKYAQGPQESATSRDQSMVSSRSRSSS